jgi:glycosyltransferase, family 2
MISVIVPTYNAEKYLSLCLDSILNQSYRNIEIVCVNDGSTDNSIDILKDYAKKDSRVKIVSKLNGGLSSSRNCGIENSTGEYLLFVDADDELEKDAILKLYKGITKEPVDAAVGTIDVIYEAHEELKESDKDYYKIRYTGPVTLTDDIINNFHCSACGVIFKRSIIEDYHLRFPVGLNYEDAYWHWCYFTLSSKINFIPQTVYRYYRHPVSIMSQTFENKEGFSIQHLYIAEKIFDFWKKNNMLEIRIASALKIIESFFWLTLRYCQEFEKAKAAYECARILKKFELDVSKNDILKHVKEGNLHFLYREVNIENHYSQDKDFVRFLQIKNLINQSFPHNTLRRKVIYNMAKIVYRILRRF